MKYDIAIIGGGPAGYTAGERAAENGLKTILFEKNAIGGVCLNEGCIPTKTLLYSAKILDSIKSAAKYGIQADNAPGFDLGKIIARKNKTVKKLTLGVKAKLNGNGVTIIQGEAVIRGEEDGYILIQCGEEVFAVKNILLCTGSETVIPTDKRIVGDCLLDFERSTGCERTSPVDCYYRWRSNRNRIRLFLQQHGG